MMGNSPRIIPVNYGQTLNNTKKVLRENLYERMVNLIPDYTIIDFDLKSCYTSILLGLYPAEFAELKSLQLAIEQKGLWEFIKEEFKIKGALKNYDKSAVKICVYSSFFLGGNEAMNEGILESYRQDVGLTKPAFRKSSYYEKGYEIARKVTDQMQNSSIIPDFRDIAKYIYETHLDDYLIGPTGHHYFVNEHSFRMAYPNYLQSYEVYIIATGTLNVLKNFPEVELIGHFPDGNVLAIPLFFHFPK
jgi:hypothetical protein